MIRDTRATTPTEGPAFYAQPRFLGGRAREWWTLLHPPYTLMHLSFCVIGACLVGPVNSFTLSVTVLAFFLGLGVSAHALDEMAGRPLATSLPHSHLVTAAVLGLVGAVGLGVAGSVMVSAYLLIFIALGIVLALGYNLELFGGLVHNDVTFALSWGSFPLLTAYFVQHHRLSVPSLLAGAFAALLSLTQRHLSVAARDLRRRTLRVEGEQIMTNGTSRPLTTQTLLAPYERALRSLCGATITLAVALAYLRFLPH